MDQVATCLRELKRLRSTRLRNNFQPAVRSHAFDVAAERRRVKVHHFADDSRSRDTKVMSQHKDIELTDFDTERPERVVVDADYKVNRS